MKLLRPQNQIKRLSAAFSKLMPPFWVTAFLLSFHLSILSQISPHSPEVSTTANLAVVAAPPSTGTKDGKPESNKTASAEKKLALVPENLIHNGDTLDIDVLGSLDYDWRGRADDNGFLSSLPHLNVSIFALCRTEDEIGAEITAAYSKIIRNPQVVVRVVDRSAREPAILFGAVSVPQRFKIQRPVQLSELIVMSGGITDKASGEISVFRPAHISCLGHNQNQVESEFINLKLSDLLSGKTDANPQIRAGDVVTVAEAAPVYVTGGVVAPQRILFRKGMTLSRAVASAGGLGRNADQTKITIYRRRKDQVDLEIIKTNLDKINDRTANDEELQAYDIIDVAQSGSEQNRHPPIVTNLESNQFDINKLPTRVVD